MPTERIECKAYNHLVVSPAKFHKAGLKFKNDTYVWRGKRYLRINAAKVLAKFKKS